MAAHIAQNPQNDLALKVYRGDRSLLIAYDLDQSLTDKLAGFAIKVTPPNGQGRYLKNRLSFAQPITAQTTPAQRETLRTTSDHAPFQKFRWTYFPPAIQKGRHPRRHSRTIAVANAAQRFRSPSSSPP